MTAVREKRLVLDVSGTCRNETRTDVRMRRHAVVIDEPPSNGGDDAGALPLEVLLASFAGCTNVIAHKIAHELNVVLTDMTVDVRTGLVLGVIHGAGGNPFPVVELTVTARSDASPEQMGSLRDALARRCPVSILLRRAGCEIVEDWRIEPAEA